MEKRFAQCKVVGCERNAHRDDHGKSGCCSLHYQRFRKHGDASMVKRPPSPAKDWLIAHVAHDGEDCLTWPFAIGLDGYGRVHNFSTGALTTASRQMCLLAHGEPPTKKHEAAHSCGMGHMGCVNPQHLYWATPTTNHADKVQHGTTNRGSRQGGAKLIESDVVLIRSLLGTQTQTAIAARFGVDPSHISDIKRGKRWGWMP